MKNIFVTFFLLILFASSLSLAQDSGGELEQQLDQTTQDLSGLSLEEINKSSKTQAPEQLKESFVSGMMSGVIKQMVTEFLKENPFSKMPREEVKTMITVRTNGLPIAKVLEKNPKVLEALVDWIRDEAALPRLISIVNKPDQVKTYGFIVISVFVISFILNLANSKSSLFKRIIKKMMIFFAAFFVNIGAFFFLFKNELDPTLKIILKYIHL